MSMPEHSEPVIVLGATRRERLKQFLNQALDEWRRQWGCGSPALLEVDVAEALCRRPAMNAGRVLAYGVAVGDERLLVVAVPVDAQHELLGMPAPKATPDGGGEVASAVFNEALYALCSRLAHAKDAEAGNVTSLQTEKLSAAWAQYGLTVMVKTAGERVLLRARLLPKLVQTIVPPQAGKAAESLVSRRSAIGIEAVAVQAWLGEAEVTLGDLANLQVGDVILLQADVSTAGHLALPDGRELAAIRLGSAGGRRAVSVVGKSAGR